MSIYKLDLEKYAKLSRQAVAEGCVLIKNEESALPLRKGDKVAVFGRIASTYYKSGLGSGGMVNTAYVVGILDALRNEKDIAVEEKVRAVYDEWIKENPFDEGRGWGMVPWSQEEMPVSEELFDAAKDCNVAVVIIGRTAGEDQDNHEEGGSYCLTEKEDKMVAEVCKRFKRTIVVLNVGNIIDMSWMTKYNPEAVLYAWQGGQEGGNGVADVLMGRVNPCGKLTDTIAYHIKDYPADANFGDLYENFYKEDIFVGYRYFETFAKEKVMYPFGFGLSYTSFDISAKLTENEKDTFTAIATVKNTGSVAGKEVVQIYVEAPQGKLGKAARALAGFAKTKVLAPGEEEALTIKVDKNYYTSFDDAGLTGCKNAFVLEEGEYKLYAGSDVRVAKEFGSITEEFRMISQLSEAVAPTKAFERMCAVVSADGKLTEGTQQVPLRTINPLEKISEEKLEEISYTGNKGYLLRDVYEKKVTMDEFVAQLTDEELITIQRGEGMSSPKVTPGTAAAFGGITEELRKYGIPALCATDGPSGLRMDCGTLAFSLPNGTSLGCTFNLDLVEELYDMTGKELRQNRIDTLLGPGINIHRHPLNGRNFEYISEDPILTGKMAVAQLAGLNRYNSTGTIKHFSGNNQETKRHSANAVVSQRALREIYLKCFEIAVKEGHCKSVMTTYGPLNGIWTAGSYDLNTVVLRKEWGFKGIVMTDWWAGANDEGEDKSMENRAPIVRAQNDLIMVTNDAANHEQDNILENLKSGRVTRAMLVRNAKNTLDFALDSVAMQYEMDLITEEEIGERKAVMGEDELLPEDIVYHEPDENGEFTLNGEDWKTSKGTKLIIGLAAKRKPAYFDITIEASSELDDLAQLPVTVYLDNAMKATINFRGSNGKLQIETRDVGPIFPGNRYLRLFFGATGLEIKKVKITFREEFKGIW